MNQDQNIKAIHLGCGEKRLEGFINIDNRKSANVDIACNMLDLPFDSESIDLIYMCHSLEHVPLPDIKPFLSRLKDILRPSGKLYISVPDFEILSSLYLAKKVPLSMIVRAVHGGQEYEGNTHYFSYDYVLLKSLLESLGFQRIQHWKPEIFLPKNYSDTSSYEIAGKRISLNLMAEKHNG